MWLRVLLCVTQTESWSLNVVLNQEPLSWVEFWRKYRLAPQIRTIMQKYPYDKEVIYYSSVLLDHVHDVFWDLPDEVCSVDCAEIGLG